MFQSLINRTGKQPWTELNTLEFCSIFMSAKKSRWTERLPVRCLVQRIPVSTTQQYTQMWHPPLLPVPSPQPVCVGCTDFQLGQTWEAPLGEQREKAEWSQGIYSPVTTEQKSIPQQVQTMSRTFSLSSSAASTLHQAARKVLVLLSAPAGTAPALTPFSLGVANSWTVTKPWDTAPIRWFSCPTGL